MELLKEILDSNLISAIIALVGVVISLKWSTSKTTKGIEQALKVYESELSKKVYASSKRADMEYERIQNLNRVSVELLQLMQRLYPDKISTYVINYNEKPTLNDLALKVRDFDNEINLSKTFLSDEIIKKYEKLLENAESFFVDADKHNLCWDDNTKEDHQKKIELRDNAYESRIKFAKTLRELNGQVKEYLLSEE